MYRSTLLRRVVASAACLAATGLTTATLSMMPAAGAVPALTQAPPVLLGTSAGFSADAFTQAANGSVFYSIGSVVYVVKPGLTKTRVSLHAAGKVLALAATATGLFVQVGLKVTEYSRTGGAVLGAWTLTSAHTPVTSAGLLASGNVVWSETDWATDKTGFEYATVSRITAGAKAVHLVSTRAYPADMAATGNGLYYEGNGKSGGFLALALPSGNLQLTAGQANVGAPAAFWGNFLELLSYHGGHQNVDIYGPGSLTLVSSHVVALADRMIAGTAMGLISLRESCPALYCVNATVAKVAIGTGAETGAISVPGAYLLLPGTSAAVIAVSGGKLWLVRVTA